MQSCSVRPQLASRACFAKQISLVQQAGRPQRALRMVVQAKQQEEERSWQQKLAGPSAALMAAALLFAATPDVAEAARSGGRVGGSSGFSRSRASAPRASAPRASAPRASSSQRTAIQNNTYVAPRRASAPRASSSQRTVIQNNTYVAPPVFGGYGMGMPFFGGFGGFGFYPVFGVGLGTVFNLMLLGIVINVVFSVISGFTNQKKKQEFDDEDW